MQKRQVSETSSKLRLEKGQKYIETYYNVSGGPMIVTFHSNTLQSSTRPAEKPSTGFLEISVQNEEPKISVASVAPNIIASLLNENSGMTWIAGQLYMH